MISARWILWSVGALSLNASAYEQATHALLTARAFEISSLADSNATTSELTKQLGLNIFEPFSKDEAYFEMINTSLSTIPIARTSQSYEQKIVELFFGESGPSNRIQRWLIYGAIREDDNPTEDPPTPDDVALGLERPLNHFYDPALDRALTAGVSLGRKAVDWAIGSANSFQNANSPETPRSNSFTVMDAREAMFRGLTLMTWSDGAYVDIAADRNANTRQQWRQQYWATTFRALGDVLHLNQDMAQPQHTRNDAHSGRFCVPWKACPAGHTSVYEKYIDTRARGKKSFNSKGPFHQSVEISPTPLLLDGYPIPMFSNYPAYWSTAPGKSFQGKGLADYSNHGFFSAGKNFGESEYTSPPSNTLSYTIEGESPRGWDGVVIFDMAPTYIFYGNVRDTLMDTTDTDIPLTTLSNWDQFVKVRSATSRFSLNRINYDAMADLLLPRAVAYSAGLINFFFRGQIEISLPQEGVFAVADHSTEGGFEKVRAKIKNTSPIFLDAQGLPQVQNMDGGSFFAVIRYHKDNKYVGDLNSVVGVAPCSDYASVIDTVHLGASTGCRDGAEQIVVSKPVDDVSLDAGDDQTVDFDFSDSPIPFGMTDVVLQIVYRGPLGSENDAVAVGTLDVSEPTYFTYLNASDYIHIGAHVYQKSEIEADTDLLAAVRPQYCVDYQQSPPKIRPGCLEEFDLDLTFSFEDVKKPIATAKQVPTRQFVRLVYLGLAEESSGGTLKRKDRKVTVQALRHRADDKAILYQQTDCLPIDPFDIPPRRSQLTVLSSTEYIYAVDRLKSVRGVNGWYNVSCVVNGDDAIPGTPDNRNNEMAPLGIPGANVMPFPVTINALYVADPT